MAEPPSPRPPLQRISERRNGWAWAWTAAGVALIVGAGEGAAPDIFEALLPGGAGERWGFYLAAWLLWTACVGAVRCPNARPTKADARDRTATGITESGTKPASASSLFPERTSKAPWRTDESARVRNESADRENRNLCENPSEPPPDASGTKPAAYGDRHGGLTALALALAGIGWLAFAATRFYPTSPTALARGAAVALAFGWLAWEARGRFRSAWIPALLVCGLALPMAWHLVAATCMAAGAAFAAPNAWLLGCPWAVAADALARPESGGGLLVAGEVRLWAGGTVLFAGLALLARATRPRGLAAQG